MNKITILGSGTSTGVPILGCNCKVCQSTDPRNKRFRTSAIIENATQEKILIDATPDLRSQLLACHVSKVDSIVITHDHADHTHGMDDLRPFGFRAKEPLPVYTGSAAANDLKRKFAYIFDRESYFKDKEILGGGIPLLNINVIEPGFVEIQGEEMEFFYLPHGHDETLGFRHSKMAYIVDCRQIPESILTTLSASRLELLVIDCLRPTPHQTHLHLDLTLEYISRINPRLAVLTHMGHEWDYLELTQILRRRGVKNTVPAIDGQWFHYS